MVICAFVSCERKKAGSSEPSLATNNQAEETSTQEYEPKSFEDLVLAVCDGRIVLGGGRSHLGAAGYQAYADGADPFLYHPIIVGHDRFAYRAFSAHFSDPVEVTLLGNDGGIKTLRRYWKVDGGFLCLTAGRDPRDCFVSIKFHEVLPNVDGRFVKRSDKTTISEGFLQSFEVKFVPFSSVTNKPAEQGGAGQPAARSESDSQGGDKP